MQNILIIEALQYILMPSKASPCPLKISFFSVLLTTLAYLFLHAYFVIFT